MPRPEQGETSTNRSTYGLALRFILSCSLIVALATASLTLFFLRYHLEAMELRLRKRCRIFTFYLAKEIGDAWPKRQQVDLGPLLQSALLLDDVLFAQLVDTDGKTISIRGRHPLWEIDENLNLKELRGPHFDSTKTRDGIPLLVVTYPVICKEREGPSACVIIGVSTASLWQSVGRARQMALMISLVVLAISVVLIIVIVRRSAQPLVQLAEAASSLADGDLSACVIVESHDEVGDLARAFNLMVERLRLSRQELEQVWEAQERSKMEHVVESMIDAVVVFDEDEKVVLANREAREILGLEAEADSYLTGLRVGEYSLEKWIRPVLQGKETVATAKLQFGRPRIRHLQLAVSAMHGMNDEVQGAIAVLNDLTAEVEMSQQLLQSEKLAALGQLASGVAHEVNNPLTVISGFAEMLRRQVKDTTQHNLIEKILEQAQRCSEIVTSLSRFSRKSNRERGRCDVNKTLRETSSLLLSQLRKVNVTLVLDLCQQPAPVIANVNELQQVVFNLMNNARDAMPEGGTITLRSDVLGDTIRFSIKDDGKGIAKEKQTDIFAPFFTTKDPGKGTGLGLAVCSRIIDELDGRITVESEEGRGTTFFINLPKAEGECEEEVKPRSFSVPSLDPPHVLVIDDEADILAFCEFLLHELGYTCDTFTEARDAIKAAQENEYGLFLFDVRMPGMNGPDLLKVMRNEGIEVPIVFMSGLLDIDATTLSSEELGHHALVRKPFDARDLALAIRTLL